MATKSSISNATGPLGLCVVVAKLAKAKKAKGLKDLV